MFIRKEWELQKVSEYTHMRNAALNAIVNANRKRGKKFIELFTKRVPKMSDEEVAERADLVKKVEERDGKRWVDRIYQAAGIKKPVG